MEGVRHPPFWTVSLLEAGDFELQGGQEERLLSWGHVL